MNQCHLEACLQQSSELQDVSGIAESANEDNVTILSGIVQWRRANEAKQLEGQQRWREEKQAAVGLQDNLL